MECKPVITDKPITIEEKFDQLLFQYSINYKFNNEQKTILQNTNDLMKQNKCNKHIEESFNKMIGARKQMLELLKT
jgi:hypothetical protein